MPLDKPKTHSTAIQDNSTTEFGRLAAGWSQQHSGKSGFFPFAYGQDALGARLAMAEGAQRSIDLQYFLMKDDDAGAVLSAALWRAANRGVRIRFLLDDVFTTAPDSTLLALNEHPNVEVRLFNPISRRGLHALNFVGHFRRANRRMHNKSFVVDNAIGVVGGRNIADEYFQLKSDAVFSDFDVLAFGPIVEQVSDSFDQYWNHALAIPINHFAQSPNRPENSTAVGSNPFDSVRAREIFERAVNSRLIRDIAAGDSELFVAESSVIADNPDKLLNAVGPDQMGLAVELGRRLQEAEREIVFITPYYVPGKDGIQFLRNLTEKDVKVSIVTNSLASTNHIPVHSAYSGYRRDVLESGAELYEIKANAGQDVQGADSPEQLTLHTKLILIDRRYLFVGSLNLDPRSIEINAEMGLMIDSPELTTLIADGIERDLPAVSYKVLKTDRGRLEWHSTDNGHQTVDRSEPLIFALAPIQSMGAEDRS